MKTLIVLSLIAAFASPSIAEVTASNQPGKAHCAKMEAMLKREREIRLQSESASSKISRDARG